MGIRPFAEQLLQGAEQALNIRDIKATEKVNVIVFFQTLYK